MEWLQKPVVREFFFQPQLPLLLSAEAAFGGFGADEVLRRERVLGNGPWIRGFPISLQALSP
jgi:hypothetical protein